MGTRRPICWDLKSKQEKSQEVERKVQKDKSNVSNVANVKIWVIMQMNARMRKTQVGMKNMSPLQ